jgi:long-chain acyl-CoA synthetase
VDLKEIGEETNLYTDLGLDSLLAVELLLFIERDLGISVSDERISSFQTVGDVLDELRRQAEAHSIGGPTERVRSALPYAERPTIDRAILGASFTTLKTLFQKYFQLQIENPQSLPLDRPYIVAANHSSHLDSVAVISALSLALGVKEAQRIHVIGARDYFFNSPLKGWLFSTCLNVVPIERDEIGLSGLRMVGSILSQGEPVLIFPEGTRSRTGELQEFKPGVGLIAWEYQVPIVPAFIKGAFQALPAGKNLPKPHPVEVRFGELVRMDDYRDFAAAATRDEVYRKIAGDLRATIVSLQLGKHRS